MPRITRLFALFALAASVACGTDYYSGPTSATDVDKDTYAPALGIDLAAMTKTTEGVYYVDKVEGTGAAIAQGDSVRVWYTGYLSNGQTFDTNQGTTDTLSLRFKVGDPGLIEGFSIGVRGMKVGGRRLFIIPSALAFGAQGSANGQIPRYANLIFDVSLLNKF